MGPSAFATWGDGLSTRNFFVITGIDAAGKTTLLSKVAKLRPDWEVGSYRPRDWLPHPDLPQLDWELQRHPRELVHQLGPLSRASFLLHMMLCHWEYWLRPRLEAGKLVLMDSYYYRFYAKEKLRGQSLDFFYRTLEQLPDADTVILAELDPESASARRDYFDTYEVFEETSREDFIRFQRSLIETLTEVCSRACRRLERIDASLPSKLVAEELIDRIETQRADRQP